MNASGEDRTGLVIISELYELTLGMAEHLLDSDFLIDCVEKRQLLMDEYDAYRAAHPDEDTAKLMAMVKEMVAIDKKVSTVLDRHKSGIKDDLTESQSKQRAAGYAANYISSSGSYMDYKK